MARAVYRLMRETIAETDGRNGYVWTEFAESEPLGRGRIRQDAPGSLIWSTVTIGDQGEIFYNPETVEIEIYEQEE